MDTLFSTLISNLIQNPVVLGAVITSLMAGTKSALSQIDKSDWVKQNSVHLHTAFLVLAFLASVAEAASKGQLSSLDLTNVTTFLTYWIQVLVGGKAMSIAAKK